jgi:hypothetical protein
LTGVGSALVSVDGISAAAVKAAARRILSTHGRRGRCGISHWDASGLFEDLVVAGEDAGVPSARTLLLLYASDLVFRLRWEIEPALAEGKIVVAAPYVDTAIAFGRASGLPAAWLTSLFQFAPRPTERRYVDGSPPRRSRAHDGFIEFGIVRLGGRQLGLTRQELAARVAAHLDAAAVRRKRVRRHAEAGVP